MMSSEMHRPARGSVRDGKRAGHVRDRSTLSRWAGALCVAAAMGIGAGPASAGNATMQLSVTQSPNPATYGASASYVVTLTNISNNTINNVGLTINAPAGAATVAPGPTCVLSTALPCAVSGPATAVGASGYQLPKNGTLTINVPYYMPAAASPLPTFNLNVTGTSSNNASGPNPAAYTTITTTYITVFAPPPPVYPTVQLTITQDTPVLYSQPSCAAAPTNPDCGATYYGQYTVMVTNTGSTPIDPSTQQFEVEVTSPTGAVFADSFGCQSPCAPGSASNKFLISGLGAGGSTSFTVLFTSPQSGSLDVKAVANLGPLFSPPVALENPAPYTVASTNFSADAPLGSYAADVPSTGGSSKARNFSNPQGQTGPYSTRTDVPKYPKGNSPATISLLLTPETSSCSPSSPVCLDSKIDVQVDGVAITLGGPSQALNGTDFLVITMVRDWTTLGKKPSSVFNATVWYTDDAGNRTNVKDCGSVDLTIADRCIYQRIDMTTSAKGVVTGGYVKFIIWARHNGIISW